MEQETRKILRCPVCEKGRIADVPAEAVLSQYRLFAMGRDEPADIIAKCPRCGMQVGITVRHRTEPPIIVPTLCRERHGPELRKNKTIYNFVKRTNHPASNQT